MTRFGSAENPEQPTAHVARQAGVSGGRAIVGSISCALLVKCIVIGGGVAGQANERGGSATLPDHISAAPPYREAARRAAKPHSRERLFISGMTCKAQFSHSFSHSGAIFVSQRVTHRRTVYTTGCVCHAVSHTVRWGMGFVNRRSSVQSRPLAPLPQPLTKSSSFLFPQFFPQYAGFDTTSGRIIGRNIPYKRRNTLRNRAYVFGRQTIG